MKTTSVLYSKLKRHDDWRWDSEFLCDEPYHNKNLAYKSIGQVLTLSQYGLSIDMNEDGDGCKIYRMNEISDMFCDRSINKYAKITAGQINKFKLKDNDVLFNRTNSLDFVGRTGIFKKFSEENLVFASYLIRVRTNESEILPEYLTTFLNTRYGIQDAKRRARISINQSNINAEELKRVEIPILSKEIQDTIRKLFKLSFQSVNKSELLYEAAEQALLNDLGLLNWRPKHRLSFVKKYSDTQSSGRIDAEYFQPKYDEVVDRIKQYKKGYQPLSEIVTVKDKNFQPKDDVTYRYIELANISANGNINGFIEALGKELPTRARRKVNDGDVIVSTIEGSLSSIALIAKDLDNALCSTGFFVVNSDKINSETLLVLLKSSVGQLQLKKGCSGTILTAIGDDEFKRIILPDLSAEIQKDIKKKITEMYDAKRLSKHLLDIAKRGVEMAIDKSEKDAESFINVEIRKLKVNLEEKQS
ncbi:MAG: restriction endonuclease subunit S [Candidatus Omnitrophica bacterium]|jgi:restriction endonuclease S subunit|nr:restriction endonuclease subunit S [Candidatus Omnitrophota bacterium]